MYVDKIIDNWTTSAEATFDANAKMPNSNAVWLTAFWRLYSQLARLARIRHSTCIVLAFSGFHLRCIFSQLISSKATVLVVSQPRIRIYRLHRTSLLGDQLKLDQLCT
jgi:hypothetical protein